MREPNLTSHSRRVRTGAFLLEAVCYVCLFIVGVWVGNGIDWSLPVIIGVVGGLLGLLLFSRRIVVSVSEWLG